MHRALCLGLVVQNDVTLLHLAAASTASPSELVEIARLLTSDPRIDINAGTKSVSAWDVCA